MQIALNIEYFANPVVRETKQASFVARFFGFLLNRVVAKLNNDIDRLIIATEGFYAHTNQLDKATATKLLVDMQKVIKKLDKLDESMQKDNYLDDKKLEEKSKYMLAVLYKLESMLHKIVYADAEQLKMDNQILDGVTKLNQLQIANLLVS